MVVSVVLSLTNSGLRFKSGKMAGVSENKIPKKGDTVTFESDLIDNCGNLSHKKGDKAVIREVEIRKGYWSRLCPDIWVPEKATGIKLVGIYGLWSLRAFEETKELAYSL